MTSASQDIVLPTDLVASQLATQHEAGDRLQVGTCTEDEGSFCCGGDAPALWFRQTSEAIRARATDAMDIVQYLQEFSVTPPDFGDLSELFSDDKRMAEAAVRALGPGQTSSRHVTAG